jgi:hypothetical protein
MVGDSYLIASMSGLLVIRQEPANLLLPLFAGDQDLGEVVPWSLPQFQP